jgi:UDP-N-acetylmuramoyl-tripeptide--D-alanyl-D-alanine ligase
MNIKELYRLFCRFPYISTDTRKTVKNSIFFALHGEKFDGNAYAAQALRNGAAYAVADDRSVAGDPRIIIVDNTLSALQQMASYHRKKLKTSIIAITGSNGKTTTKDLIAKVLSCKYTVCSTQGNLNNHIGVPLTILSIKSKDQFGVVEMGANHPGEIAGLCRIAQPGYGLITNIGRAHLEGFGSVAGVMKAKRELYDYLEDSKGKVFVNCSDRVLMDMLTGYSGQIIRYGNCEDTIFRGETGKSDPYLSITASPGSQSANNLNIRTRMLGDFNTDNVIAALGVGSYFGIDIKKMVKAIMDYSPDNLRSQVMKTKHNTLFIDAYNANPTSMQAAIRNFQKSPGENKMLIIGEMAELGEASEEEHRSLLSLLNELNIKRIFLVGNSFYKFRLPAGYKRFRSVQEMFEWLGSNPVSNANILLKGSRIIGLEKLIPYL